MRAQPSSSRFFSTIPAGPTTPTPPPRPHPPPWPTQPQHQNPLFRTLTTQRITNTLGKFLPIAAAREPGKPVLSRSCLHSGVKQNYVDFLPNLPVESLDCSQLTSHASVALLSEFGTQFLLSTQPESRLHCGNTPECFACFLAEFVFRPRTTPPQTDLRVKLYFLPRRVLSPKHIFFNTIKPLLVLTSSPSRTNTNFNTLQCSFPKPPLNAAFISPIPQNHIHPPKFAQPQ